MKISLQAIFMAVFLSLSICMQAGYHRYDQLFVDVAQPIMTYAMPVVASFVIYGNYKDIKDKAVLRDRYIDRKEIKKASRFDKIGEIGLSIMAVSSIGLVGLSYATENPVTQIILLDFAAIISTVSAYAQYEVHKSVHRDKQIDKATPSEHLQDYYQGKQQKYGIDIESQA